MNSFFFGLEIPKENAAPHETKMKWNQEDLGQAPHTRQGICTTVRVPSPRPLGSHKTT